MDKPCKRCGVAEAQHLGYCEECLKIAFNKYLANQKPDKEDDE